MIRLAVILIADQFRYDYLTLLDQKFLKFLLRIYQLPS